MLVTLVVALRHIERFGEFCGLQINWRKYQILPLNLEAPSADQASLPMIRASQIKYLGVQVSQAPAEYTRLNVEPLIALPKTKTQTCPPLRLWDA